MKRFAVVKHLIALDDLAHESIFCVMDFTNKESPINGRVVGDSHSTFERALASLQQVREQERDSRRGPIRSDPASQGTGGRAH